MQTVTVAAIGLVVLALAACSGGEGPDAGNPAIEASSETMATAGKEDDTDSGRTATALTPTEPAGEDALPAATTPSAVGGTGLSGRIVEAYTRPAPRLATLPTVEFPDDIALLAYPLPVEPMDRGSFDLVRIYRNRNGELVRETLFAIGGEQAWWYECGDDYGDAFSVDYDEIWTLEGQLPECGGDLDLHFPARFDPFSIVMTVCIQPTCIGRSEIDADDTPGRTAIYESRDGGVTWEQLSIFESPWYATRILPESDEEVTELLLQIGHFWHPDLRDNREDYGPWPNMLWPDGELLRPPTLPEGYNIAEFGYLSGAPLSLDDGRFAWPLNKHHSPRNYERHDLYLTTEGEDLTELVLEQTDSCPKCLMLPDGRLLLPILSVSYKADELVGPQGAAEGRAGMNGTLWWLTIRDPETGWQWPVRLPYNVLQAGNTLVPVAVQQGPFLRVVDMEGDCLPLMSDPSSESQELDCVAERVLLQDQGGGVITNEDITWRKVKTPAGIEGWADSRYLE